MAVGEPIETKANDDEEQDQDDDTDPNPDSDDKGPYVDYIGDIEAKLKQNKLLYVKFEEDEQTSEKADVPRRAFKETLQKLRKKINSEEKKANDVYPYRSRFISIVDRRKSKKDYEIDDTIITYQPPSYFALLHLPKL